LQHVKKQSMHLFGDPIKAKSTMTQINNPFIEYQKRLLFGVNAKRHLSPMEGNSGSAFIPTKAEWHNGLDNFLNLNKQRNDVKDGTLRSRPMTIYCQGEVKEVEEDVNDQSIEVRDIPHLNELHLDKN
jgi:hypothetical protein